LTRSDGGRRETFRRTLREKGPRDLKAHQSKRMDGEIMTITKTSVVSMAITTPVYEGIQLMVEKGFRRIPVVDPGSKRLRGIVTAYDLIDYLGGGEKFQIIQREHAGNFFKAINEPVRHIMSPNVISVSSSAKINDVIDLMVKRNVGCLPIVDKQTRLRGIVTERDVIMIFRGIVSGTKVSELMSKKVVVATPETSILEAERLMVKNGFRRLPIVSEGKVVSVVTVTDILRFFGSGKVFQRLRSGAIDQVLQTPAIETATGDVVVVERNVDAGEAAMIMLEKGVGTLPVLENEKLVGMITERDFFKLVA
jgi:CBS domain-containing protein